MRATDRKVTLIRTHLCRERWPAADPAPLLQPGCATVAVLDDEAVVAVLRWWVADGITWFEPWPGSQDTALWPSVVLGEGSTPTRAEVWFDRPRLDGQDELLARAVLSIDGSIDWEHPPADSLEGLVVRELAHAVAGQLRPATTPTLASGEVLALPGPALGGLHEDLRLRSWHARVGDAVLRALEFTPIRDEDDEVVARRAQVHWADAPRSAPGEVVWKGAGLRYWPGGSHPMVHPPQEREQWTGLERLLLDRLALDWASQR